MRSGIKVNSLDNNRHTKLFTRFIDVLIFLYILSIYILSFDSVLNMFSRLLALGVMAILAVYAFLRGSFKINGLPLVFGAFLLFCLFSCIWAVGLDHAVSKTWTVAQIFILIVLLHNYLATEKKFDFLLNTLLWCGTFFSLYVIATIGIATLLSGAEAWNQMMENINNLNAIGFMTMISALISIWKIFYCKKYLYIANVAVAVLVAFASGSRTTLLGLLVGLILLFVLKGNYGKKVVTLLQGAAILVALFLILRLPAFKDFTVRIEALFDTLILGEDADYSASIRLQMIELGFQEFLSSPILGHGIGYSAVITPDIFGWATYLHNNYIELLASVGIIGTCIYYAMFAKPLFALWKHTKVLNNKAILSTVILLTVMATHIGTVDYYDKLVYLYILLAWLCISEIESDKEVIPDNVDETAESN